MKILPVTLLLLAPAYSLKLKSKLRDVSEQDYDYPKPAVDYVMADNYEGEHYDEYAD